MKLNEEIENLITEEQGIANEMYNIAANICFDLYNTIKSTPKTNWDRIEFVSFKKGIKKYRLWNGNGIEIRWFYYNFYDKVTFDKEIHRIRQINATSENLDVITITVLAISGNIINDTLFDTIHHELEHVYKFDKAGKNFSKQRLYRFAIEVGNKFPKGTYQHLLYNIIYLSREYEQDAYNNGLYAMLMKSETGMDEDDIVYNCPLYNGLQILKKNVEILKNTEISHPLLKGALSLFVPYFQNNSNNENKELALENTRKRFIKEGETAIDKIQRKMARTIFKARTDYMSKNFTEIKDSYFTQK